MRLLQIILTVLLVWCVGLATGMFPDVQVNEKTPASCGTTIHATLNFNDPNHGVADENGVTWTQVGDGFDIKAPSNMKVTGGIIYDPSPENRMHKGFRVISPSYGRILHFSYTTFPMGNSGDFCIVRK